MNTLKEADERDPYPTCKTCECAEPLDGETLFIYCNKKRAEISAEGLCDHYIYDLIKRIPRAVTPSLRTIILEPIDF